MARFLLLFLLSVFALPAEATKPDTLAKEHPSWVFNTVPYEQSLVFSSVEWYNTVIVADAETGKVVRRVNLKRESRRQNSQLVFVFYGDLPVGEYAVVAKNGKRHVSCKMLVGKYNVILIVDND